MPVPVPSVPTAYPVHKRNKPGDFTSSRSSAFLLKHALLSPSASPLATHEQRISALPSCRRANVWEEFESAIPAHVHQGFTSGLAGAVDAPAIKGAHVQTCLPPLGTLLNRGFDMPSRVSPGHVQDTPSRELRPRLSPISPELIERDVSGVRVWPHAPNLYPDEDGGLFAPTLEDDSPDMMNGDMGSSPIEPVTPFGDYVDRAVAASDATALLDSLVPARSQELQLPFSLNSDAQFCHLHPYPTVDVKESVAAIDEHPSTANFAHKRLAEPMAEWIVSYVWKVCTNLLVLPQAIAPYTLPNAPQLRQPMPPYLTARVHSLLMSTLLQPSAILLALWYIVRLPIYFGAPGLGPEHVKERRFRVELLGDTRNAIDGESLEGTATFRVIVLGCMLANKWLDDHTFSNKTWHTISNVPVQVLNKLEYFALDILSYDLSISPSAWFQWLGHLLSYHHSLTTTTHPQPIARPASSPHGLIRKTIQEIMEAPLGHSTREPIFLGVEQRLKEKLGLSTRLDEHEAFDIDLDEDGPLREEYLPRRRVSNGGSLGDHGSKHRNDSQDGAAARRILPPPAKWSPAGDEPICRPNDGAGPMYLPVQPSLVPHYVGPIPAVFHPWPTASVPYAPFRHHPEGDYAVNAVPIPARYTYWAPLNCASAVQHLQPICSADYYAGPNHIQGYPLAGLDYRGSDICSSSDRTSRCHDRPTATWTPLHQHGHAISRQSLATQPPPMNYRSTWIRA